MAMSRWDGWTPSTTRPPMLMLPPLSGSRPAINRSTVLLPHPLGPTITMSSPWRTNRVRCTTADVPSAYIRETSSSRTSAISRYHHQPPVRHMVVGHVDALSRSSCPLLLRPPSAQPALPTVTDRARYRFCGEPDYHHIHHHLSSDHQPRRLGLGGDITEADRRKDGNAEVQRIATRQWLAEIVGGNAGHDGIGASEQQQEQRNGDGQRLDRKSVV